MFDTKTEIETCPNCDGKGYEDNEKYRPEPDYGCRTCGGDGMDYKPTIWSKGMKKGSGKIKVTYKKNSKGEWYEINRTPY